MPKQTSNNFTEDFFLKKGYTKNPNGGFDPPVFKHAFARNINERIAQMREEAIMIEENKPPGMIAVFNITPIGKPRMTQSDKWKVDPNHTDPKKRQRKCVSIYWKYKDELMLEASKQNFTVPEYDGHIIFYLPMPHSWSEKKKALMNGTPHQQKPDSDNLAKSVFDSLLKEDCKIWDVRITKY